MSELEAAAESITLQVRRLSLHKRITVEEAKVYLERDICANDLVLVLEAKVYSSLPEAVEHRYPTTWWDAFKERWFPRWARVRWPASWTVVRMERGAYYPTIPWNRQRHAPAPYLDMSRWTGRD